MSRKEILIICLIMCFILSLQAVVAADVDNNDTKALAAQDFSAVISNDVSAYSLPNSNTILQAGSDSAESFSELQSKISPGGSITLDKNYTFNSSSDGSLKGGIQITTDTTIIGNDIVIDADNQARVFRVASGATLTLRGITFINGNPAQGPGGSIFGTGVVHIDDCKFINNTANYANGGAICVSGFGSTITNSYFEGNRAIKNPNNMNSGGAGAVFLNASNVSISNSIFVGNMAGLNGGGVGSSGTGIENCTITNCTFTRNTANGSAGGVGMQSRKFVISDSKFIENTANGMFSMYPGNGGGMVMRGWDSYAYNCTFINNTAKSNGGASYLTNTSYNPMNNNTGFILCTFIDNTAGINGGAVTWANNATCGYINDSIFINNTAKRSGGAVYWNGHNGTISNTSFINNKALGIVEGPRPDGSITSGGDGGAIVMTGANANILNSTFRLNNASRNGGAIFMQGGPNDDCTNVTVDGSKFIENYAGVNGGALDWYEGAHDATLSNSILINNTAERSGGAVYWYGHDGTIVNSTFTNNKALGLVNATDSYGNITPGGHGGAIMWTGLNGKVLNSNFTLNNASRNGGAIYMQGSKDSDCSNITVDGSRFIENYAGINGGALDWYEGAHNATLSNSVLINNTAERSGGAVYWYGHDGSIINSTFENNKALGLVNATDSYGRVTPGGHGGAIIWTGLNGKILNSNFTLNNASRNGGAIFMQGSKEGNKTIDCSNMTVDGSNFTENYAGINGGALDWYEGAHDSTLSNSKFINNTAERSGGAVYWYGHDGSIINSTFENNKALGLENATDSYGRVTPGGHGGAIIWTGANGKVLNSNFTLNNASRNGGAIYMQGSKDSDCSNITVDGSRFIENYAGVNGGALDWYEGAHDSTLSNSYFANNTAERNGGAIYWYGHNGTVANSTFIDNVATGGYHQYNMTLNMSTDIIIIEGDKLPSSGQAGKLYVLDNSSSKTDVHYSSYVYDNGNWTKLDDFDSNEKSASPTDWAIDQFFGGDGGSIYWTGDLGTVDNCTFINSKSARRGGGAYMTGGDNITFSNCNFTNGTSGTNGGGVDWLAGANYGKLINCTFTDNQAARSAGAIYYDGDNGQIINVTIINSYAHGGDKGFTSSDDRVTYAGWDSSHFDTNTTGGDGGAIMFTGSNNYVYNVNVINCTAVGRGGAIFVQDCTNVTIVESTFTNNTALGTANNTETKKETGHGGAIAFDTGASDCIIEDSTFDENKALTDGGAVYFGIGAETGRIVNSTFTNNNATTGLGGALVWRGYDGEVEGSLFTDNYARGDGGAAYIEGESCSLSNSTFDNNTAGDDGGAVYWTGDHGEIFNVTANNNKGISEGTSHSKGGTIIITGSNMTVDTLAVSNSFAEEEAGGLFLTGNNVNITNAIFINCSASMDRTAQNITRGGGSVIIGNNTRLINVTIEDSKAEKGGAVYWEGNDGYAYNVTAARNYAPNEGGALYITGENCQIYKSEFTDNIAGDDGGAINWEGDNGHIEECNFENNTGLSMWDQYENRYHTTKGGAVSITGDNLEILNSNFTDSTSKDNGNGNNYGGTLFITGENVKIDGCNFNNSVSEGSDGGTIYIIGNHTDISNSTFSNSTARAGGAIYIEGIGTFIGATNFTETSAKSGSKYNSNNLGGAIYIKGVDTIVSHSNFENSSAYNGGMIYIEGDNGVVMYSSMDNGYAARDGGAIYSTGSHGTVSNSSFTNNLAELSGGAMYWYGGAKSTYNTVDGCIFTNNTAHGNTTNKDITRGGGAIYWSEGGLKGTVKNSEFYYNSVQSTIDKKVDGGAILWDKSSHALVDNCTFVGNFVTTNGDTSGTTASDVWAQGGAMYLRPTNNYTVRNCHFENCSSSKEAGAVYIQSASNTYPNVVVENSVFINNVAEGKGKYNINGGGAIQIKQCKYADFRNLTFINNTANKGGGLCVYDGVYNLVVDGANFTGNKANKGSAISASVYFKLNNAVLLNNTADTTILDLNLSRENEGSIDILMEGADTHLNAMYVKHGNKGFDVTCNNVTYWRDNNITIGQTDVITGKISSVNVGSVPEKGIAILVEIFDGDNKKLHEGIYATDADGRIHLELADILKGVPYSTDNIYVNARLPNEDYYTMKETTSRIPAYINASALDTIFHRNTTVTANITAPGNGTGQAARGNVSVYIDDIFIGNMTIENSKGSLENILTNVTADKFLEAGNHTVFLKYWGDAYFDESNTTISLNITKAQANSTVTFHDVGYDISMNVTIFDEWDDKFYGDANGTATVEFYSESDPTVVVRSVDVSIVDGIGSIIVHDLLPRNYTVKTIYHDDHNYNSSVNTTNYSLPQKDFAAVFVEVNAYDIMVDDTVYINITIVPPENYNVPGNVTLYLDNQGYNLPLTQGPNNATAKFNATNLTAGIKKVIVFYEGSKLLEPAMGEADFRVHKYNTTLSANVTNITIIQNEIINITLLNDTTGVVSAIVDGKEYFGRIKNGTASIELPLLPIGKYNVTLYYEGDGKYNNVTNYTVFYVIQVTPEMIIDIENVTYGNSTHIVITLPGCAEGNVSIEIDGTTFGPKPVDNGRVEFVVEYLTAGNYTLEATYTGDDNHTAVSGVQNFTVYKANRTIVIEVHNIPYGEIEHIKVYVNATGNVTIFVDGRNKTIELNESDVPATILRAIVDAISEYKGKAALDVYDLNVGEYPVEVIYNGNENYNMASAKATFIVYAVNTNLVIDAHDVVVWDNEYINVTVRNSTGGIAVNATGNITININGVNHTVEIVDGVARINTTALTVGVNTVCAYYDGDGNYIGNHSTETFVVSQRTPKVNVTATNSSVDEPVTITVTIPANATGFVVISGNFTDNEIYVGPDKFTNGIAQIDVNGLANGTYNVHIIYYGLANDNYTIGENDTTFTVSKLNTAVTIDVNDTVYDNSVNIVVNVTDGVEGSITIKLNNTEIGTYGIVGGKVNITLYGLGAENYTVYAIYNGNYKYNINNTESKNFTVARATPVITIDKAITDANSSAVITVHINDTATGTLNITVNGTTYEAPINDGVAEFTVDVLPAGEYDITANYYALTDTNYTVNSVTLVKGLNVTKVADYPMNVSAIDVKAGENTTITVTVPEDATGIVYINVNGTELNKTVSGGQAVFNVVKEIAGRYVVNATLVDAKYGNKSVIGNYYVSLADTPMSIEVVEPVHANDTAVVIVTVPENITGPVTIEINGEAYVNKSVDSNKVTFEVPGITYGNKTVVAIYGGDAKYLANSTTENFTVVKNESFIRVDATNSTVDGEVIINVTVPANAVGYVIVNVNGTNYTINVTAGEDRVAVKVVEEGLYNVTVTYIGDDNYLPSSNKTDFTVSKLNTTVTIDVNDTVYDNAADIVVTVEDGVEGSITIKLNNTEIGTYGIVGGKVNITLYGLGAENYTIYAEYNGNYKYNENKTGSKNFTVARATPVITIDNAITDANSSAVITVHINDTATGTLNITVNGKTYEAPINDGVAEFTVDVLPAGEYDITANYYALTDTNYTVNSVTLVKGLNVTKVTGYPMNVSALDVAVEDNTTITVIVPGDATGIVYIDVNGTKMNKTVSEGKAEFSLNKTISGKYTVNATLVDAKYGNQTVMATYYVYKVDTPISIVDISTQPIYVNDTVTIAVTVPGDIKDVVTIEINGEVYYNKSVTEDGVIFEVPNITYGNKTVVAIYGGDNKYRFNSTTGNFTVSKRESFINVDATNSTVDGEVIINVTVPENAIGYVVVNVNGTNYTINLTDGQDRIVLKVTEAGIYNVNVTYIGDDQFLPSNNTASFKVDKLPSFINVTISDDGIIANGTDADIFIQAPSDITGNVTVIVWDKVRNVNKTYTVYVNGGEGILHLESPAIGNYSLNVTYLENRKYLENITYAAFEIYDNEKKLEIRSDNVSVFKNEIVYVHLAGDQTGNNLTIIITNAGGEVIRNESVIIDYYSSVFNFSSAQWKLPLLDAGTYDVEAIYIEHAGPRTYVHKGNNSFEVYKEASSITIKEIRNVTVGQDVTIELELTPGATGNISVFVNGVEHKTTADNLTIIIPNLGADVYVVDAVYHGDEKYNASNDTSSFRVDKNDVPLSIDIADRGDVVQINVTVGNNATGQILLDIEDNHYYANITDGVAQFNITGLKAGEHNVTATYIENNKYYGNTTNSSFTISKYKPEFTINGTDIDFGMTEVITIETKDIITSLVTVEVNSENYTTFIKDGKGSLTLTDLAAGDYNITLYFPASEKYESATAKNNFTVSQVTPDIRIVVENITYGEIETIMVYVNATGNVTIEVGGQIFEEEPIVDGMVSVDVSGLDANNYTVKATYNGNANFTSIGAEANFTVAKADPFISVDVENIIYGNVEYIVVHVNASGNVTITISGTDINETISLESGHHIIRLMASRWDVPKYDGTASLDVYNLAVGTYNVNVTYNGNKNYNTATAAAEFNVTKDDSSMKVDADTYIKVGDNATVTVELPENVTGTVTVEIDGEKYTSDNITDGVVKFTIENLTYGNKTIAITYSGDGNYSGNFTTTKLVVDKYESSVNATIKPEINVGENPVITVEVPKNATGWVIVEINNETYAINVNNGTGSATIKGLPSGEYPINVTYLGDKKYFSSNSTASIKVSKVPSTVNVTVENITVGDKAVINISTPADLCGNVTVSVNGENHTVFVSGGQGTLVLSDLPVGNYTVDVTFDGCRKYEPSSNTAEFEVAPVEVDEIKVIDQGNGTITIVAPDIENGNITVKVGNVTYNATVVDGIATVDLVNNTPGTYNVTVIYEGDDTHAPATAEGNASVPKYPSEITADAPEVTEGEPLVITVDVPDGATGNVTVYIDGKNVTAEVKEGVAVVTIDGLTAGNKTYVVEYSGDGNFSDTYVIGNATVKEAKSDSDLTVVDYGNGTIAVVVGDNATGNVTVVIDGKNVTAEVKDGVAIVDLGNVTPGTHEVEVVYSGDDTHNPTTVESNVTAPKYPSEITVDVPEVTEGEPLVITVDVPDGATGNVTVYIDGKNVTAEVKEGVAVVTIDGLTAGNKTYVVEYSGDGNFSDTYVIGNLTVKEAKSTPDITVVDQGNGTVVVVVGDNATGNVTVVIDGKNVTAEVKDGVAVVDLDGITPGDHDIEVVYSGDDNHNSATAEGKVSAPKYDTPISVDVADSKVGDKSIITVNVPEGATGNITLAIEGKQYTSEIKEGKATFEFDNLTAGNKTIAVEYAGDDLYVANHTIANVSVSKNKAFVNATVSDIDVGENVTITVNVPEDATGQVLIDIDGVGYYVNVTGGTGTISIPRMPNGNYTVSLTYTGDDKYEGCSNSSEFTVSKVPSFVKPYAEDIVVGDNEVIKFVVPEDATGTLTVIVDGEEYNFDLSDGSLGSSQDSNKYSVAVSKGNGILVISGLPEGEYVVSVKYDGDDKYLPSNNKTTFKVIKKATEMEVIDHGNGTISVILPEDAEGNVTVKVGNRTYTADVVHGIAVINLDEEDPGVHEISVIYSGDGSHEGRTTTSEVTIPKYDTPISVDVSDIEVGETAIITVNVPEGSSGNVTIEINAVEYSAPIINGKAVFNITGLSEGNKTVAVKYIGDNSYVGNSTTGQFSVSKVQSGINATSKDIHVGTDGVITVTLPSDATGRVLVDINGIGYYGKIINGKAKIIIPELSSGEYTAEVTYEGDDKYLPSTTTTSFVVVKTNAPISIIGDEIEEGQDATVVVKVPDDATGTVTIDIDGKKYTTEVKDGKAVFVIPGLTKGDHKVTASYSGDKKYEGNDTIGDVEVYYNGANGDSKAKSLSGGVNLADYPTGNPIWLLLLVLLAIGSTRLRRFKE